MIRLDRDYASTGIISAGSGIYVFDDDLSKYVLLIPTSDMPAGAGAPDTIDNPILTVSRNGQVEGKQTVEQKEYTFNWNRDNIRRLNKYVGKQCKFLERDGMEYTGNIFIGTIAFDKDAFADNEIMNGNLFITVNEDLGFVDDIRDLYALTAVIKTPLPHLQISGTNSVVEVVEATAGATITATSETPSVATVTFADGKATVTGVATGSAIIKFTCSATGEATSERTQMVTVIAS